MQRYPTCRGFEGYLALYITITWYKELTPEQAFRIMSGKSKTKPPCKNITLEMVIELNRVLLSKNFKSFDKLEQKYRIDRYTIVAIVNEYRKQFKATISK